MTSSLPLCNIFPFLMLLFVSCNLHSANAQDCEYTSSTGRKLYLDALAHTTMTFTADRNYPVEDKHTYTYTPCRNGAGECTSGSGTNTAMARQTISTDPTLCTVVANWDSSVQPVFSEQGNGTWIFTYKNGDTEHCADHRVFIVTLFCKENIQYDYEVIGAGEISTCTYEFKLYTQWACPGQVYTVPEESSLSAGSIFLIVLFVGLFAYFCFGWIVCFVLNRKDRGFDVVGNIPHVTFWTKLPALTIAGCCFTKDFCLGLCNKDKDTNTAGNTPYETAQ